MIKQLLVVDDDPDLRELLCNYLTENGYHVRSVGDGVAMWTEVNKALPDLIILDIMLPGEDGLSLCRNLRSQHRVPVLMLTARGDEMDRIIGLEMGADDYLPKPFHPRELLARIKSILRRVNDSAEQAIKGQQQAQKLVFSGWTLDLGARHLIDSEGVVASLSTGEFRLLRVLAENPNQVLSRDQLMDVLAGREAGPFDRSIDVMISRLRKRLEDDAREPRLIKTIRNEGYILATTVEKQR